MSLRMIARGIAVEMYVGIRDFEYQAPQTVIVNVEAEAVLPYRPRDIGECLDYTRICDFVYAWKDRPHTDLVETLLFDVVEFCFADPRVTHVDVEILKPTVIAQADAVGVGLRVTRADYQQLRANRSAT
ncbi:MAG TPA: dihydroneopterin aldolase [Sulfuriferula sp.]|nr:dihydroneopterin aldolase [Sulfuriferula sp.]